MTALLGLTSGGVKSAVAIARHIGEHKLICLHVDYGQLSAAAERSAVTQLATHLKETHKADIQVLLQRLPLPTEASLETRSTPAGRTAADTATKPPPVSGGRPDMHGGLTPLLFSLAARVAAQNGAGVVVTGISSQIDNTNLGKEWGTGSTDRCREWLHALNVMLEIGMPPQRQVHIEAPLIDLSYSEIVRLAERCGIALEHTWSCDQSSSSPCGKCSPCLSRRNAFQLAQRSDPRALRATA